MYHNTTSIIVQGPIDYPDELIAGYSHLKNVVVSTWDDTPQDVLDKLRQYFKVLVSPKGFPGYRNINLQVQSVNTGFHEVRINHQAKHILKTRTDMFIRPSPEKLIQWLELSHKIDNKPLSLFCYNRGDLGHFCSDMIVFGSTNQIGHIFNYKDYRNNPDETPPETLLWNHYFKLDPAPRLYSEFLPYVNFMWTPLHKELNQEVYWAKHKKNLSQHYERLLG